MAGVFRVSSTNFLPLSLADFFRQLVTYLVKQYK